MIEDALDDVGLGNEADHAHLAAASGTHQGVDLVHPADQLCPTSAEGGAVRFVRYRYILGCLMWRRGFGRGGGLLALTSGGVRVGAVVAHEMTFRGGDLDEDPGHEFHGVDPLAFGRLGPVVPCLGHVEHLFGARGEVQADQADRRAHHVAYEGKELALIARMHDDPVVHGEAASPPRIQQLDPILAEQPPSAEKSEYLVSEEPLGRCFVHIG
jgi:hypothetical protein